MTLLFIIYSDMPLFKYVSVKEKKLFIFKVLIICTIMRRKYVKCSRGGFITLNFKLLRLKLNSQIDIYFKAIFINFDTNFGHIFLHFRRISFLRKTRFLRGSSMCDKSKSFSSIAMKMHDSTVTRELS